MPATPPIRMLIPCLALFAVLLPATLQAQLVNPLIPVTNSYLPGPTLGSLSITYEGESRFVDDTSRFGSIGVSVREMALNAGVPMVMKPGWKLTTGLGLRAYQFAFSTPYLNNKETYIISVPFGLFTTLSEQWNLTAMLAPSIYSDFERVTLDDCRLACFVMAGYKWTPTLTLSMGAAYSRVFGSDLFFPVAGLVWNPDPEWRVSLTFPKPAIWYAPAKRLRFSAWLTPAGSEWGITDTVDENERNYNFMFKGWRTGTSVEIELMRHVNLELAGGAVIQRRYELRDSETDESVFDSNVNPTWFVQTGLVIRP